jgi:hypothetical protein
MARLLRAAPRCRLRELFARGWAWAADLQPAPTPRLVLLTRYSRPGESWEQAVEEMTR